MNILVTGGLGVNGCWVTRALLEMGHHPVVYDTRGDFSLLRDIADSVELVIGDILDYARLASTLKKHRVERICHLAASYPGPADANPLLGFQVNALGTVNVLEAARLMDIQRVVFTSSYGALSPMDEAHRYPGYRPVDESYPAYPAHSGVYAAAKVSSELMGHVYRNLYGTEFVALRYAAIFGPGKTDPRHGNFGQIWTHLLENAMLGRPTRVVRGGDERQDMVYARDVAHSVVLGCLAPSADLKNSLFHIASGKGYTIGDFAAAIRTRFPDAEIQVGPGTDPRGKGVYCVFDISRARAELGYEPQFTLPAAVRDWVEWMDRLGFAPQEHPPQIGA